LVEDYLAMTDELEEQLAIRYDTFTSARRTWRQEAALNRAGSDLGRSFREPGNYPVS
jgi:hypothetical protein